MRAAAALLILAGSAAGLEAEDVAPARFSRAEWIELASRYARGERAEAIGELGAWRERDLVRQVAAVEEAARAAERCPRCPNSLEEVPLRAAVMLHWDRDRAEQPSLLPGEVEVPRRCPGPMAGLAGRLTRVMSRSAETSGFARRFFRMVTLQCQWDACFANAERWASEAILSFPRDTELLITRGSVREEVATIGFPCPTPASLELATPLAIASASARRARLENARQDFADALAIDPRLGFARLRLGRVLWRLGEREPARHELEAALASLREVDHVYLAHLFLGRVHQDAGRLEEATAAYRLAVALHPSALSAGTALSNALFVAGDADAARAALRQGLARAGRRSERDPLRDYLVLNAADFNSLTEALHGESLE
jgi:tetratricopeptide (TPR) repeat protein